MLCDEIDRPAHYNIHPSGVECIDIVEEMGFNIGNAIAYLWRARWKGQEFKDYQKAIWYINREIQRRTKELTHGPR